MDTDSTPENQSTHRSQRRSRKSAPLWHAEEIVPGWTQAFAVSSRVYSGRTAYQKVEVLDTEVFGRCLVLDDKVQSSTSDEFVYHEALVHPALLFHPDPRAVLIAGGGEGVTLREVLRHRSVTRAVMLDIDQEVVELCQRYLPMMHQGSFEDPRAHVVISDAWQYLESTSEQFDVVVLDLTDPLPEGPARLLYSREFYELVRARLSPGGVVVTQAGSTACGDVSRFCTTRNTMRNVFGHAAGYQVSVPCFGIPWGFVVASPALKYLEPAEVNRMLAERLSIPLRFYDGTAHQGMFSLSKFLREALERTTQEVTLERPLLSSV